MSSTWEELCFYGQLASTLFAPKYDLARVPGPRGNFALGNITAVMRPDYHVQMLEWANQYGGVYKFSLGFQWVVVVSDPRVAVQVLGRGPGSIPRKCVGYKFFDLASNASGAHSFFTTSDESQWAAVRKAAAAGFSSANVRKAFPIALRHARLVAASLDPSAPLDPANPYTELLHPSHTHHRRDTGHQPTQQQPRKPQPRKPQQPESSPLQQQQQSHQTCTSGRNGNGGAETSRAEPDDVSSGGDGSQGVTGASSDAAAGTNHTTQTGDGDGGRSDGESPDGTVQTATPASTPAPAPTPPSHWPYILLLGASSHRRSPVHVAKTSSFLTKLWFHRRPNTAEPGTAGAAGNLQQGGGGAEQLAQARDHTTAAFPTPPATARTAGPLIATASTEERAAEVTRVEVSSSAEPWAPMECEEEEEWQEAVAAAATCGLGRQPSASLPPQPCTCGHCNGGGSSSGAGSRALRRDLEAAAEPATVAAAAAVAAHAIPVGSDIGSDVDDNDGDCGDAAAAITATITAQGDCGGSGHVSGGDAGVHCDGAKASTDSSVGGAASGEGGVGGGGLVVDIQEHLELAMLHVFVEALFDIRSEDFPGRQVAADMNLVLAEANERLKVPLRKLGMALVQPRAQARIRAAQLRLAKVYGDMYDIIRGRGSPPEGVTDLWAGLSRVRHPASGAPLSRNQLVPEIGALMMAGFDTSSHSVAWVLFALAAHPEVQDRVRNELVARGLAARGDGSDPRDPTLDDLSQLQYLNAVIDETMRMFPVAATASVREVTQPTRVGDYVIPPGVIVWPMLYALHNSVHNWERPQDFLPERWLAGGGAAGGGTTTGGGGSSSSSLGSSPPVTPRSGEGVDTDSIASGSTLPAMAAADGGGGGGIGKRFLPFSDGMKSCLGQALGLMEVRTMLVVLLGRYRFQLDPAMGGPEAVRRNMVMSLTLKIKGGLRLLATPLAGSSLTEDG